LTSATANRSTALSVSTSTCHHDNSCQTTALFTYGFNNGQTALTEARRPITLNLQVNLVYIFYPLITISDYFHGLMNNRLHIMVLPEDAVIIISVKSFDVACKSQSYRYSRHTCNI